MKKEHILMRSIGGDQELGLKELIKQLPKNIVMVEIGCYAGESTFIFSESPKIKKIYAVDIWDNNFKPKFFNARIKDHSFTKIEEIFDKRMEGKNYIKLKMDMSKAVNNINEKVDFVYIDGHHEYDNVKSDIINCSKCLKDHGYIGGHDYNKDHIGVIKAVDEVLGKPKFIFIDSSWLIQVK